jgi:predicted 3-demethylubiquinone-9 3-methyltransferase (glyoxalase superfamily)
MVNPYRFGTIQMISPLIFCLLALFLSLLCLVEVSLGHTNAQGDNLLNYTDNQRNFMLQYPNDWNFTQKDDGSILFTPILDFSSLQSNKKAARLTFFGPKITISLIKPFFPDITSEELCNNYANLFENAGYTIYHKGPKVLPNVTDQVCTVQYATQGEKNKAMNGERNNHPALLIVVKHNGIAYNIEYSSTVNSYFSKYMYVMQDVINSFRFIE